MRNHPVFILLLVSVVAVTSELRAREPDGEIRGFLSRYCSDCHDGEASEAGLDLSKLELKLENEATFSRWELIFDRVQTHEMPPEDATQPPESERSGFVRELKPRLLEAHAASKGTVLRRLNRREYQNTINDLFGTNLDLAGMLPEDGKAHEFDNVGEALGVSMVHLQRYMDAARLVLDTSIASTTTAPEEKHVEAGYLETSEAEKFLGKVWKKLSDGAVVRFGQRAYPSGMVRGTRVREPGRYRVRVTGYAYQSEGPITFSVGGTSFVRGSEKPIYGFWSFAPGKPGHTHSIEFETWIDDKYMITIEPFGINDPKTYQRKSVEDYSGPGLAILNVTLDGPLVEQWPSRGHQLIFDGLDRREIQPKNPADRTKSWYRPAFEIVSADEDADAERTLRRVAEAAFRRPVSDEKLSGYLSLFKRQKEVGSQFEESLRTAVIAILCSPEFLYFQESPGRLDDYALAGRLAYFLTRTAPDRELLELASAGRLTSDDRFLQTQSDRLMKSENFERFIVDFTDNWLNLRDIDFTVPDRSLFPEYDAYLRYSLPLETRAFLRELIEQNLPVTSLVRSDFAMLNSRLADHYELPSVSGSVLRRVSLPAGSVRGGLLTQASILKVTANGTNTSPVTRGAWVMERILGTPPPPPPPGIPGVEPDIRGASTLRELLEQHRNLPACNACHAKIDPPGFALESFDPIGGFRRRYRSTGAGDKVDLQVDGRDVRYRLGPAVDSSGVLPSGQKFEDFVQFRDLLAADADRLAKAFVSKLLTFGTGRAPGFSDRETIDGIVVQSASQGHGLRDLMHLVIHSEIFRNK